MGNVLGFGIVLYGGYLLSLSKVGEVDFNKGLLALIGGIVYLLWANAEQLKNYLPTFKPKVTPEQVFIPADYPKKDFECLYHLKMRVTQANSKEGIDTCSKLNDIIFTLDNPKITPVLPVVEKK